MAVAFVTAPWSDQTFKCRTIHFVDKIRDIVGLYRSPPIEPSSSASIKQIQALDREQPVLPICLAYPNVARTGAAWPDLAVPHSILPRINGPKQKVPSHLARRYLEQLERR